MAARAAFSTSGAAIVTTAVSDGIVRVSSMRDLKERFRYSLPGAYIATLCGDSSLLAVAAAFGTRHRLVLLNAALSHGGVLAEFILSSRVLRVMMSLTRLVVVCEGACEVFDLQTSRQIVSFATPINPKGVAALVTETVLRTPSGAASPVTGTALARSVPCFLVLPASVTTGDVAVYDLRSLEMVGLIRAHESRVSCAVGSPDGKLIATSSERGTIIRVHAVPSGKRVASFRRGSAQADIRCIAWLSPPAVDRLPHSVGDTPIVLAAAADTSATVHLFAKGISGTVGDAARTAAAAASATVASVASGLFTSVKGIFTSSAPKQTHLAPGASPDPFAVGAPPLSSASTVDPPDSVSALAAEASRQATADPSHLVNSRAALAGRSGSAAAMITTGGTHGPPARQARVPDSRAGLGSAGRAASTGSAAAGPPDQQDPSMESGPAGLGLALPLPPPASPSNSSAGSAGPSGIASSSALRRGSAGPHLASVGSSVGRAMRSAVSAGLQLGGAEGERAFAMLRRAEVGGGLTGDRVVALSVRWASEMDWASKHQEAKASRSGGLETEARPDPLEVAVVLGSGLLLRYSIESAGSQAGEAVLFGEDRLVSLDPDEDMDTDPVAVALSAGDGSSGTGAGGVSAIAAAIASAHERESITTVINTTASAEAHEATTVTETSVSAASVASSTEPAVSLTASPSD